MYTVLHTGLSVNIVGYGTVFHVALCSAGLHTEGGGGAPRDFLSPAKVPLVTPPPPQNFESLCTILYGFMVLGDFSWSFD